MTLSDPSEGPALFLFKGGRRARIESGTAFPSEMFYGFCELDRAGLSVSMVEEDELRAAGSGKPPARAVTALIQRLFPALPATLPFAAVLARRENRRRFADARILVATTNTLGYGLALLRRLGLLDTPVVFVAMGVFPEAAPSRTRWIARWLLRACTLAPISEVEADVLRRWLGPKADIRYLPFGIDADFWTPRNDGHDYVLSVGNDLNRDYTTLIEAWKPEYPPLRIITRLPVTTKNPSVTILAGDWRQRLLSDAEVRDQIRSARFVVLPLRDTLQPAGQSACLQAMACGKAVVISAIRGLWDPSALRDGETCVLVPPGSVIGLRGGIERLLEDRALAGRIGAEAHAHVATKCDVSVTAQVMAGVLATTEAGGKATAPPCTMRGSAPRSPTDRPPVQTSSVLGLKSVDSRSRSTKTHGFG